MGVRVGCVCERSLSTSRSSTNKTKEQHCCCVRDAPFFPPLSQISPAPMSPSGSSRSRGLPVCAGETRQARRRAGSRAVEGSEKRSKQNHKQGRWAGRQASPPAGKENHANARISSRSKRNKASTEQQKQKVKATAAL